MRLISRRMAAVVMACGVLTGGVATTSAIAEEGQSEATAYWSVTTKENGVAIRTAPRADATVLGRMYAGDEIDSIPRGSQPEAVNRGWYGPVCRFAEADNTWYVVNHYGRTAYVALACTEPKARW